MLVFRNIHFNRLIELSGSQSQITLCIYNKNLTIIINIQFQHCWRYSFSFVEADYLVIYSNFYFKQNFFFCTLNICSHSCHGSTCINQILATINHKLYRVLVSVMFLFLSAPYPPLGPPPGPQPVPPPGARPPGPGRALLSISY